VQIKLDGQIYTDTVEQTTAVDPEVRVVGVAGATGLKALQTLAEGASIRFRSSPDASGTPSIYTVVVQP
jgi:hypothetical protein